MKQNKNNSSTIRVRRGFMITLTIIFGSIGLHDFIIKKWGRGLLHILLVSTPLVLALLKYNPLKLDPVIIPNIFFWTSYCWGIIELYFYLKKVKLYAEPEAAIDYNTFTSSNRVFLFIFTIMALVEILFLAYIIFFILPSLASTTHNMHGAVLAGTVLALILTVHGIITIIAVSFFKYCYKLKCILDSVRYVVNQRELKIFTIVNFCRKIIKPSIALNIGLFTISIIILT